MQAHPSLAALGRSLSRGSRAGRLFYFDSASVGETPPGGLPLLFIHGLGDEADSFRSLFPFLSAKRRLLALDLPGFGRSEAPRGVKLETCVRAVLDLLALEAPEGAVLVGSSLGAVVAELALFRDPRLAKALVLMDGGLPSPLPGPPSGGAEEAAKAQTSEAQGGGVMAMLIPGLGESRYRAFRGRPEAAYRSLEPYYADLAALPAEERAFLAQRVMERVESESQMRAYCSLLRSLAAAMVFRQGYFTKRLKRLEAPILVLWGEADGVAHPSGARLLSRIAPASSLAMIKGAGHLPHQEKPSEVIRNILAFLDAKGL